MKKQFFFILVVFAAGLVSCKKSSSNSNSATNLYISYTLDGVNRQYTGTTNQINTGLGAAAYSSSGFFDLDKDVSIDINMEKDSIVGNDFLSLVGQKIKVPDCVGAGCGTSMNINDYSDGELGTGSVSNPFPTYYFKVNTVSYLKTVNTLGTDEKQYLISGEFNIKVDDNGTVKSATNGKFNLIFQEIRD
jgi:hypothetical protein